MFAVFKETSSRRRPMLRWKSLKVKSSRKKNTLTCHFSIKIKLCPNIRKSASPLCNLKFYNPYITTTRPGLLLSHVSLSHVYNKILKDAMTPKESGCIFCTEDRNSETLIKVNMLSSVLSGNQIRKYSVLKLKISVVNYNKML